MIPPAFFPTLQSCMLKRSSASFDIGVGAYLLQMRSNDQQDAALMEFSVIESILNVVIRGRNHLALLNELREMVEKLLNRYEGIELNRSLLCPGCLQCDLIAVAHTDPLSDPIPSFPQ